eukprot:5174172-Pleurochrysis_carterae.AAC.1
MRACARDCDCAHAPASGARSRIWGMLPHLGHAPASGARSRIWGTLPHAHRHMRAYPYARMSPEALPLASRVMKFHQLTRYTSTYPRA